MGGPAPNDVKASHLLEAALQSAPTDSTIHYELGPPPSPHPLPTVVPHRQRDLYDPHHL